MDQPRTVHGFLHIPFPEVPSPQQPHAPHTRIPAPTYEVTRYATEYNLTRVSRDFCRNSKLKFDSVEREELRKTTRRATQKNVLQGDFKVHVIGRHGHETYTIGCSTD